MAAYRTWAVLFMVNTMVVIMCSALGGGGHDKERDIWAIGVLEPEI